MSFLLAKCEYKVFSETPAADAMRAVVVPSTPYSATSPTADSMISCFLCAPVILPEFCICEPTRPSVGSFPTP